MIPNYNMIISVFVEEYVTSLCNKNIICIALHIIV